VAEIELPSRGFGSIKRLAYIAAAQQMLTQGQSEREVVTCFMDEGITEAKAYDYVQVAQSRIKRALPAPEVPKARLGKPFEYDPPPEKP